MGTIDETISLKDMYNGMVSEGRELVQHHQGSEITGEQLDSVLLARMLNTANQDLDKKTFDDKSALMFNYMLNNLAARPEPKDVPRRYYLLPINLMYYTFKRTMEPRPITVFVDFSTNSPVLGPLLPPYLSALRHNQISGKTIVNQFLNP